MDMSIRFPNLKLQLDYVGRSVSVFGFELTFFGLLIAVGMLLGLAFVLLQAKRRNEDQNLYLEMLIPALLGGVTGARLFYVFFSWELYRGQSLRVLLDIRNGGMSLCGGILGGILFSALYCKIRRISFSRMADTASMGLLIAQTIGVWGNFFNREAFGDYTDSFFAMQIPREVVQSSQMTANIEQHLVTAGDTVYIQVHPLFLYESAWCLFLFLLLLVYTRRKKYQGEIFLRYLAGYSLGRVVIEWLRTDSLNYPGTDIPVFLPVSAAVFIVCGISATVCRILWKKREKLSRRRREERYAAEEKAARDYSGLQSYENVAEEFLGQDENVEATVQNMVPTESSDHEESQKSGESSDVSDEVEKPVAVPQDGKTEENSQQQDQGAEGPQKMSEDQPQT